MEKPQSYTLNFTGFVSDSKRIILAGYTHYLALSFFFLPLCATITSLIITILNLNLLQKLYSTLDKNTAVYLIIYIIFVYTITQCGIATITYSTHHRVLDNPMSLLTVLKSLKCTFFPIFFTSFVADVLLLLMTLTTPVFLGLVLMLGQTLGVVDHISFLVFSVLCAIFLIVILGVTLGIILVKWSLACTVVVAESKWGYLALKRSWHLHKGMNLLKGLKWAMLLGIFIFCGGGVVAFVYFLIWSIETGLVISKLGFVLWTVFGSLILMMILLVMTVKNGVAYYYLKAFHGELAVKIDQEYVQPPTDVEKVPHGSLVLS